MSGKTAQQCGWFLIRSDCKDTRPLEHLLHKSCRPVDREAMRSHATHQTWEARSYFNQVRINTHVKQATPSGTIPTSRSFPSQGRAINSRCAILLNAPLAKIQPACRPIANQSERVRTRASARIQPMRNNVVKPAATNIGLANCENE